jgi:hypothetical protein
MTDGDLVRNLEEQVKAIGPSGGTFETVSREEAKELVRLLRWKLEEQRETSQPD